jgi:bifunctional non-homologous end joining protein LigD
MMERELAAYEVEAAVSERHRGGIGADSGALVFFLFDLLHLDGKAITSMPVTERKERLRALLPNACSPLHFSDHQIGRGRAFYDHACTLKVEGIVSKRVDAPTPPAIAACGSKSNA